MKPYNNLNVKNALVQRLRYVTWYTICSVFYLVQETQKVKLSPCKDPMKHTGAWKCNSTNR